MPTLTVEGAGSVLVPSGKRLVNFDLNVVAQNGANPISYTYADREGTCVLVCHGVAHPFQQGGSIRTRTGPIGIK